MINIGHWTFDAIYALNSFNLLNKQRNENVKKIKWFEASDINTNWIMLIILKFPIIQFYVRDN